MVTIRPVVPSSVPNEAPMSVSRAMGMNSELLKMKAATAMPKRASQVRSVARCDSSCMRAAP